MEDILTTEQISGTAKTASHYTEATGSNEQILSLLLMCTGRYS